MSDSTSISLNSVIARNGVPTGGKTDQILAKSSNTPYKLKWVDMPTSSGNSGDLLASSTQRILTSSIIYGGGGSLENTSSDALTLDVNFSYDGTFYPEDYGTFAYAITDIKINTSDGCAIPIAYSVNGVGVDTSAKTIYTTLQLTKYKGIDYSSFTDNFSNLKIYATVAELGTYSQ